MADNKIIAKRKLTGAFFQSLDGVIQAPGGPKEDRSGGFRFGGWIAPLRDGMSFWSDNQGTLAGRMANARAAHAALR